MTEKQRHNAGIVLSRVRGKTKTERMAYYAMLRLGPYGVPVSAVILASGEAVGRDHRSWRERSRALIPYPQPGQN